MHILYECIRFVKERKMKEIKILMMNHSPRRYVLLREQNSILFYFK
jgi:hypothetical protein